MHLGLTPWRPAANDHAHSLTEQARWAEQVGYDSFWLAENHFNTDAIPEPLMLLASVAASTTTIKLATSSYLLPLRHPLHAAEQVAVLDQLSQGRLILGLGRGMGADMFRAFDIEPKDKRQLFKSNLDVMISAWRGEKVKHDQDKRGGVVLHPLPKQQPHPPLWVAAFGPKALQQAGKLGLPYLASPIEALSDLHNNYLIYHQACADAGRAIPVIRPVMRMVFISEDEKALKRVRRTLSERYRDSPWRSDNTGLDDWTIVGNRAFARAKISEYREQLGLSHLIITHLRGTTRESLGRETPLRDSLGHALDICRSIATN